MDDEIFFNFAIQTSKKMKELKIVSITQNDQEIQMETKDRLYKISSSNNNKSVIELNTAASLLASSSSKRCNNLTGPAIKMAKLLHELLKHLDQLPTPVPTMNPKFDKPELYNQVLLRKLERGGINSLDDDDFLAMTTMTTIDDDDKSDEGLVSEVDLLKIDENESHQFNLRKEDAIKKLSFQIGKIYNDITKIHIEEEDNRRMLFRSYVDILSIQRRIEIYCSLYKSRNKGETIKNQSTIKILKYCDSINIKKTELKNILRAAKRIENLLKVANDNWSIIDAFPNLKINFFRSTINVHDYEIWLKIVETGNTISGDEGKSIYQLKKQQEIKLRKDELSKIYSQANIDCSEIISNINLGEDYEDDYFSRNIQDDSSNSQRSYPGDVEFEDSPRYYPDDDVDSPRYYPDVDDPMDEEDEDPIDN